MRRIKHWWAQSLRRTTTVPSIAITWGLLALLFLACNQVADVVLREPIVVQVYTCTVDDCAKAIADTQVNR